MKSWNNYNYLILTIGLIFFLLLPYMLKLKNRRLEIFPAVIMPAGASLIHKKDSISFRSHEIYAKRNDSITRIDVKEFLNPIPEWYLSHIALSNFGLASYSREIKLDKIPIRFTNFNRFSNSELIKAQKFYQARLKNLGFDDSLFIYRSYKIQLRDSVQNKILSRERIYRLK